MAGLGLVLSLLLLCAAEEVLIEAVSDLPEESEPPITNIEHLFAQQISSAGKGSGCPFARLQRDPESLLEVIYAVPGWTEGGVVQAYRSLKGNYPRLYLVLFYVLVAGVVYRAAKGRGRPAAVPQQLLIAEDKSAKEYEMQVKAEVKRLQAGSAGANKDKIAGQMEKLVQEHAEFRTEIIESHEMLQDFLSSLGSSLSEV